MGPGLCAVVLAAGYGARLRPLTDIHPKALCPVGNTPLLDLAIASLRPHVHDVAVNVHYLAEQVIDHVAGSDVHVSDERAELLASAGALGHLRGWIAGRDVLVRNVDAYLPGGIDELLVGWAGERPRLLTRDLGGPSDFGHDQYVGACLLPGAVVAALPDAPCGLYARVWQPAWDAGELELVRTSGAFVDCGTPPDYLEANLLASGGASVVGEGAVVEGSVERVVVWPGGRVRADEALADCVRVGADLTVDCRRPA